LDWRIWLSTCVGETKAACHRLKTSWITNNWKKEKKRDFWLPKFHTSTWLHSQVLVNCLGKGRQPLLKCLYSYLQMQWVVIYISYHLIIHLICICFWLILYQNQNRTKNR
jgi:hypothetical protein